jgi:hypothetical protein
MIRLCWSQIHDRGCCDKVVYQADGTYVNAKVCVCVLDIANLPGPEGI